MPEIVVKKRISLEFLGEEYKEGFIIASSLPMSEEQTIQDKAKAIINVDGKPDEKKSIDFLKEFVLDRFIEGKFISADGEVILTKENLDKLPSEVFIQVSSILQGQVPPNSEAA